MVGYRNDTSRVQDRGLAGDEHGNQCVSGIERTDEPPMGLSADREASQGLSTRMLSQEEDKLAKAAGKVAKEAEKLREVK